MSRGPRAAVLAAHHRRPRAVVPAPPPPAPADPGWAVPAPLALLDRTDADTGRHSVAVGRLCRLLATELRWSRSDRSLCHVTGLLHDVGKCAVPGSVLRKPGPPTPEEWDLLRAHPDLGADALARVPLAPAVVEGVRTHHERWDGSGYPAGLGGADIPALGRAVAVCDSLHAMVSVRPFRGPLPLTEALAEIRDGAGLLYDPVMAVALLRVVARGGAEVLAAPAADLRSEWRGALRGAAVAARPRTPATAAPIIVTG